MPGAVFVLLLSYTKPLDEVDALMRKHMKWLNEQYAAGRFLVSGRQIPRTGGRGRARAPASAVHGETRAEPRPPTRAK